MIAVATNGQKYATGRTNVLAAASTPASAAVPTARVRPALVCHDRRTKMTPTIPVTIAKATVRTLKRRLRP